MRKEIKAVSGTKLQSKSFQELKYNQVRGSSKVSKAQKEKRQKYPWGSFNGIYEVIAAKKYTIWGNYLK